MIFYDAGRVAPLLDTLATGALPQRRAVFRLGGLRREKNTASPQSSALRNFKVLPSYVHQRDEGDRLSWGISRRTRRCASSITYTLAKWPIIPSEDPAEELEQLLDLLEASTRVLLPNLKSKVECAL